MSVFDDRLKRLEERFGRRMSEACRDPAKIWMMNVNATMKRGSGTSPFLVALPCELYKIDYRGNG
jgi:hypothetical protein